MGENFESGLVLFWSCFFSDAECGQLGIEPGCGGDVVSVGGAGDAAADELAVHGGVDIPEGDVIEESAPSADISGGGEPEPLLPSVRE